MKHFIIVPASILAATILGAMLSLGGLFQFKEYNWLAWLCFICWYVLIVALGYKTYDEETKTSK